MMNNEHYRQIAKVVKEVSRLKVLDVLVHRQAILDEIALPDGRIRFRVQLVDVGREPFLTQWFNDPEAADDFAQRLVGQAVENGGRRWEGGDGGAGERRESEQALRAAI